MRGNLSTNFVSWAAFCAFALTGAFLLGVSWEEKVIMNGMFRINPFTAFISMLVLSGLMATIALSVSYLHKEMIARFEYPILVLFAGVGMLIMVSAHNMLTLYVGLELQSLALYVLAAIRRDNAKSAEAGLKYFELGALASGMLLFGMSMVYGFSGSLGYAKISGGLAGVEGIPLGFMVGMVFVLVGLRSKFPPYRSICRGAYWNPLADDGDALRLAVKLKIAFFPPENNEGDFAVASIAEGVLSDDGDAWIQEWVKGGDKLAATRRAIVRAAAEIGRAMP